MQEEILCFFARHSGIVGKPAYLHGDFQTWHICVCCGKMMPFVFVPGFWVLKTVHVSCLVDRFERTLMGQWKHS